jgi:hypothetical protein
VLPRVPQGGSQLGLLVAALVDIYGLPAPGLRGRKRLWAAVASVNFVGPISYFLIRRRR